ncbi:adenosylcobalamin-dependent ribonucleoside-diphosphate reductase [Congregibacter litoralis]|uniref:Vitamin B12-dependent ribonucleotide reductase n=1 Tax=Congregibacter litoralis KT71 TaxID=314285 RepID=A4A8K9_9GAMM|nr:adenosylcobalamin-dependent ribonucleoside-diphosphate reductase [Congregibacter litoralis]EAQ97401.1 ribonucleoside-diphosphate reductase class II [Congregibacter litoralis KT71]
MTKMELITGGAPAVVDVPMQETSVEIWSEKYGLRDHEGNSIDGDMNGSFKRVAAALAKVETSDHEDWKEKFEWALRNGATPAGRIMSNAGAEKYKPSTSTINCTVSGPISDSMEGILQANLEAGLTLKAGCGIGYEFSTLRPSGANVAGAGAETSGPLSFMEIFDATCKTVSSAGGRRGAQMGTFDVSHPDVFEFIRAKRTDGMLRQFNLSLLITDEFMEAVKAEGDWPLVFPIKADNLEDAEKKAGSRGILWKYFPITDGYLSNEVGEVACKIYNVVKARELWDEVMSLTYDYAEPGFILIDKYNVMNNNWFCENIRSTNPCGEQGLPYYGSCLLGSVNLTRFIVSPFTDRAAFDWDKFREVTAIFTRMMDNVVEINGLPLPEQVEEITTKRRHGIGYLGLGSAVTLMGMRYGSEEAVAFTDRVSRELAVVGWKVGLELAKEKGAAPILDKNYDVTGEMLNARPEMIADGFKLGDKVSGRVLMARYSRYMQTIAEVEPQLVAEIEQHGARFTHHSSIAPTGTIAFSFANNSSNGIEPSFAHSYMRNIIKAGKKTKQQTEVQSFELLAYRHLINPEADPYATEGPNKLPDYFITTNDISPKEHVDMQAASQKWIDSSISKTVNVPTEIPYDSFKDVYMYAYERGLKGCTTFRYNPEAFSGVLVKKDDLENTKYEFTLEDGSTIQVAGTDQVEYDGDTHSASNLFDALKEGMYSRF